MWCIPPQQDAAFVCAMEQVLEVYKRPHDERFPVICMDETTKQCVKETRAPQPVGPNRPARYDAEYERNGVAHLLLYYAPLENWRRVDWRRLSENKPAMCSRGTFSGSTPGDACALSASICDLSSSSTVPSARMISRA